MSRRHTIPHSPERIKRKRKLALINTVLITLACAALIGTSAWILSNPRIRITRVEVSGNNVVGEGEITSRVEKELDGKYAFLFPKNSTFFYPKQAIQNDVLNEFKRILSINIELKGPTALSVSVVERKPHSLWCGDTPSDNEKQGDDCYFMDENGFLFASAPQFSDNVYSKFYGPLTGSTEETERDPRFPLAASFLPASEFKKLDLFQVLLDRMGIKVHKIETMDAGDYELVMDEGTKIFWNLKQDPMKLASDFESAFRAEWGDPSDKAIHKKIEYADLRFDNKIFFKKRGN